MDLSHTELELVDALASFANSVDPTTRLHGLVTRGAELIGVFSGAKYVAVYIHSTEREEYGTWPEDLSDSAVEQRAKGIWAGEKSSADGEIAMVLQRGPNRIGAVVASVELLDTRHRALFRSISNQLSLVMENALLLRARSGRAVFESEPDRIESGAVVGTLPRVIYGEPVAAGFASGKALRWAESTDFEEGDTTGAVDLDRAFLDSREQLINLKTEATRSVDDTVATIFDAHLLMLSDPQFIGRIRDLTETGESAIRATRLVVGEFAGTLAGMDDPRFSEKAQDVRDLGIRLIRNLRGESGADRSYSDVVVIAEEMYPSELVSLAAQRVGGIVFVGSGLTAHISILARSLEIPSVITQDKMLLRVEDNVSIAIDADAGRLLIEPDSTEIEELSKKGKSRRAELADISGLSEIYMRLEQHQLEHRPSIRANINLFHDADRARSLQADGIGLYRSEFPFIIRSDYLTEEEQFGIYRRIGDAMPDQPLVFRTADIGGDKILASNDAREANPFLGVRGIRFSLANPHMFEDQLRAMLRAGRERDLHIMFPMVSSIDEIDFAKEHVESAIDALARDGYEYNELPKLGAMIELPSAVEIVEELADALDFLSIGTNDLVMYLLAVDRTNGRLSELYRSYHPTVLRTISSIVGRVRDMDIDLSVCGDSAADPVMLPFYLSLEIPSLSVAPDNLMHTRKYVASLDPPLISEAHDAMLSIRRLAEMDEYVKDLRTRIRDRVAEMFPITEI